MMAGISVTTSSATPGSAPWLGTLIWKLPATSLARASMIGTCCSRVLTGGKASSTERDGSSATSWISSSAA